MRLEKTVKVSEEVHSRLENRGRKGETFNEIIRRLLDETKESD